jgi:hypothetical protein
MSAPDQDQAEILEELLAAVAAHKKNVAQVASSAEWLKKDLEVIEARLDQLRFFGAPPAHPLPKFTPKAEYNALAPGPQQPKLPPPGRPRQQILNPNAPATEAQLGFIRSLAGQKKLHVDIPPGLTRAGASNLIEDLKAA